MRSAASGCLTPAEEDRQVEQPNPIIHIQAGVEKRVVLPHTQEASVTTMSPHNLSSIILAS